MSALNILLVDDDQVDREILKRALHSAGIRVSVTEADAAEPALAAVTADPFRFELGFFDLQLPGRDGLELLTDIRALGVGMPIIFLTGHGSEDTAVELMRAGAADYLSKGNLSPSRLRQSVGHVLRLSRLERDKREAERALRESEASFRRLAEHLPDVVVRFDRGGRHVYVNRPVPWSRHDPADLLGCTIAEVGLEPSINAPLEAAFSRALGGESIQLMIAPLVIEQALAGSDAEPEYADELPRDAPAEAPADGATHRILDPSLATDADARWFEVRFVPEHNVDAPEPGVTSVLAIARDVSARILHEREERRRIEFEHQLIGIVSHDLRNPIGAIAMGASLLDKKLPQPRAEFVTRALEVLTASAQRARRMVSDILDFTRARLGGGIPMQLTECDLAVIARQVVDETNTGRPEAGVVLETDGTTTGFFDGDRIAQALSNLLGNALTYSGDGERVALRVIGVRSEVRIEVENHGSTIPPEVMPVLFEPFQRGPDTAPGTKEGGSVGLGLYIVAQIVIGHRGKIEVASEGGVTLFRLLLPRRAPSGKTRTITITNLEAVPSQ